MRMTYVPVRLTPAPRDETRKLNDWLRKRGLLIEIGRNRKNRSDRK